MIRTFHVFDSYRTIKKIEGNVKLYPLFKQFMKSVGFLLLSEQDRNVDTYLTGHTEIYKYKCLCE